MEHYIDNKVFLQKTLTILQKIIEQGGINCDQILLFFKLTVN